MYLSLTYPECSRPRARGLSLISALVSTLCLSSLGLMLNASPSFAQSNVQAPSEPNPFPGNKEKKPQRSAMSAHGFELNVEGYGQVRYQRIENDEDVANFIGRNDGFGLSNARLNLTAKRGDLSMFFSMEGARDRRLPNNRAQGEVRTMMLDAFFTYEFIPALRLQFGRFKPAYDANELESTEGLLFVDRALESRGVLGVEGLNVAGLSLPRQAGVQLNGVIAFDQSKDTRFKYYLSVVNGNTAEQPLNDNDNLAVVGRMELNLRVNKQAEITLGGGAYFNEITEGEMPDLISEDRVGYTADASLRLYGLLLRGQWMRQSSTFIDVPNEPARVAQGFHAIAGFNLGKIANVLKGFVPAYRLSVYDPTFDAESDNATLAQGLDRDDVTHHTVGLNVFFNPIQSIKEPLKLQINYTIAQEAEARQASNDRLDILLQMSF